MKEEQYDTGKQKTKRQWTCTGCAKLMNKLLLKKKCISKRNMMEKKAGIRSTTAKAFFQSSELSNGLLSERRGYETDTNTFFCTCCCKENEMCIKMRFL